MMQTTDDAGRQEGLADQASEKVQEAASVAKEKAGDLREQGSARLRDQFDQRSSQAGTQVRSLAHALRRSGDELSEEQSGAAQLTEQAAERLERVGGYLEQKSGDDLLRDMEAFARRRPWMLAGLGLLAGVAAARFVKASSEQRQPQNGSGQEWQTRYDSAGSPSTGAYGRAELSAGSGVAHRPDTLPSDARVATAEDEAFAGDPYAGSR